MIGIDTNVLVRYFAQDDAPQSAQATHIIEDVLSPKNRGFISSIVLCELVWVLKRVYKQSKGELVQAIEKLLDTNGFEIEHRQCAVYAVYDYSHGSADFSDYYLAEIGCVAGCTKTVTFDAHAAEHPLFESVSSFLNKE